jgi:hypothetical protein
LQRCARQHAAQLLELLIAAVHAIREKISGHGDEVQWEHAEPIERIDEVLVAHAWSYVQIAYVSETCVLELRRQTFDRQVTLHDLEPMGLDPNRVDHASNRGSRDSRCGSAYECPSIQGAPARV